jgi:hypothetical protein
MLSTGWKPCGRVADYTDKWIIDLLSDKAPPGPKPCAAVTQLVTDEWPVDEWPVIQSEPTGGVKIASEDSNAKSLWGFGEFVHSPDVAERR